MKFVSVDKLQPNMSLARPIFTSDGRVLLNSGVDLEPAYIQRLRLLGVPGVYIAQEELGDIQFPEVISQKTRLQATKSVKDVFESVRVGKTFDFSSVGNSVRNIIDELSVNPNVLANLTDVRTYDGYTFGHCVNVCVLSILVGLKCDLNEIQMRELAIGAILHDIGKIAVPEGVIKKPGALTDSEMDEVKKHSQYGWQVLRQHPEIPLASAHVAYQHHEKPNGMGYPRNLKTDQISLYAQIVGTVDAYDAMTSERVYQSGMLPHEALKLIRRLKGIQFFPEIADLLCLSVAPYPVGSMVRLNSQEVGMVVDVNQAERARPIIRVLYQSNGSRLQRFYEVDLAKDPLLSIQEVVE